MSAPKVIASNHTRLQALVERLQVRYRARDDTQVLHDLYTYSRFPHVVRWIWRRVDAAGVQELRDYRDDGAGLMR
jgi:hypothetical protein